MRSYCDAKRSQTGGTGRKQSHFISKQLSCLSPPFQTEIQLLQQITDSGIVPKSFRYANNLFSYINDSRFQGFVSDIDKNDHCLHIQPVRYQEHIETLMEELE